MEFEKKIKNLTINEIVNDVSSYYNDNNLTP